MPSRYAFGPFTLDQTRRALMRDGMTVALSPKAFSILAVLVENGGSIVTKETLLSAVWPDLVVEESNLTFQMSVLRKALGEKRDGERYIATVPGQGYQLALPVRDEEMSEIIVEERSTATMVVEESSRLPLVAGAGAVGLIGLLLFLLWPRPERSATSVAAPVPVRIQSIAVLPFKPIVASQRDEALELGMADALINRISRLATVRPLTAVRNYGALDQDPVTAGRELGVDAVLDGSILSSEGRVRINARLLRVSDSKQLWQGQFDNDSSDIFRVQDSISERLAAALAVDLPAKGQRVRSHETDSVEAYRQYTLGRLHRFAMQNDRLDAAVGHFQKAIEIDPGYALAWAALGESYAVMPIGFDKPSHPNFRRAKDATLRALSLDPENAEAHALLGTIGFWSDWDWAAAERSFRHAISLSPNDGWMRTRYAHLLSNTGRHREAEREAQEAVRLEPLSPMINTLAGQFHLHEERHDAAMRQLERALEIAPDFWIVHLNLGKTNERMRRYDQAMRRYEIALERSGSNVEPLSMIGHLHALRGKKGEADAVIARLLELRRKSHVPATKIALPYVALGDYDAAIRWLGTACEERDVSLVFLNVNPRWAPLKSHHGFAGIERCVNLPRQPSME